MQKKKSNTRTKKTISKKTTSKKSTTVSKKKVIAKTVIQEVTPKLPQIEEKILIVCGEPSGDLLGADLIQELRKTGGNFSFTGIGGNEMEKLGFKSLHDMES